MPKRPFIDTIESKGWQLYDVTYDAERAQRRGRMPGWDELAERGPAEVVLDGGMYLFAPKPEPGQTQREAYAVQQGLGPNLHMSDASPSEYPVLRLTYLPHRVMFTRMAMAAAGVEFLLIEDNHITNYARLPHATAEQTFDRDFNIISRQAFQVETAAWNEQVRRLVE